jgi:iron complex outermembrane recepter protein
MKKTLLLTKNLRKIMKISLQQILVACLLISGANAHKSKAQELLDKPISLQATDSEVGKVLNNIESMTDVKFVYSSRTIHAERKITFKASNQKLSDVLNSLFNPLQISYKVYGARIVLSNDKADPNVSQTQNIADEPISGKVKTAKGETLPGVSILVKGTSRGTVTSVDGGYKIDANKGQTLSFSFIGYTTKDVVVGDANEININLEESAQTLDNIVVIGSRSNTARTDVERPVPVDIMTAKELQSTGQVEIGQQLQFMSPSFNASKNGINGVAGYADPAAMKGLAPDQMVVLIDGHRRHQFAAIQNNVTVGKGTVITDLNAIPSLATERLEILRDGAAAQYGSDAIAGIVNLVLKKSVRTGTAQLQYGSTSKGDGAGYTFGMNYGFALGKKGFLNVTGSYQDVNATDRGDVYNPEPIPGGAYAGIYAAASATATAAAKATAKANDIALLKSRGYWGDGTYGSFKPALYGSNAMKSGQVFYNAGFDLGKNWELYSFGGYSHKEVAAGAFLRTAIASAATTNTDIWPDGYVPKLPGVVGDISGFVGLRRKVAAGWNMDFSTGYGSSYLDQSATNSANASLGAASPKDFYAGRTFASQNLTEASLSKNLLNFAGTKSFSVAFGGQYRVDNFALTEGDAASYAIGPLTATKSKTPGSQGRVGIDIVDRKSVSRSNVGMFVDVESDVTNALLVAAALRYENYSDFGSNISGKLAARLKLNDNFSIRGSINKGFRAPLLQQIANAASTSTVQSGVITATKQLSSDDPRLAQVGIEDPQSETSWNYNLGVTAKIGRDFLFTVDGYQVDIDNRIIITENLKVANIAALKKVFTGFNEITFFTNAVNTQTRGVDIVASYKKAINKRSKLTASLALTINDTRITKVKDTPAALQLDTKTAVVLIDTINRALIETSQPHTKVIFSLGYTIGKIGVNFRSTYFGEVSAWEKLTTPNPGTSNLHQLQVFAAKTLFDLSANYTPSKYITITVGGNNITDVYPDKVYSNYASYTNGQVPYSRNVNQFGFNGAYYYGTLAVNF